MSLETFSSSPESSEKKDPVPESGNLNSDKDVHELTESHIEKASQAALGLEGQIDGIKGESEDVAEPEKRKNLFEEKLRGARQKYVDAQRGTAHLEQLMKKLKGNEEWFWNRGKENERESKTLQDAVRGVKANLRLLSESLEENKESAGSGEYEKTRKLFVDESAKLTELVGNTNEDNENVQLRDAELAAELAQDTIRRMTLDEAVDWARRMMVMIDMNDWQSKGLKETYGKLMQAVKQSIEFKLFEEKKQSLSDPARMRECLANCMEMAKLFAGRGVSIDSDLADTDFAAKMAKEAMGFEELALRFAEHSLNKANQLKVYVERRKGGIKTKLQSLPREVLDDPQVKGMIETIDCSTDDITKLSEQYAVIESLESLFSGGDGAIDALGIERQINEKLGSHLENAVAEFNKFLDGGIKGAASLDGINNAIGNPGLTPFQTEAWKLLADMEGYGYDIGDKAWSYVGQGAKIAAMIAAGVAVGIATGGLGIVAASLAGGAAMTVTSAALNPQGFDNLTEALDVYGKDFAVNTATMGAARYLAAGRAAFQLGRAGLLQSAGGTKELFRIAAQRGGLKLINSFDDASRIGTRIAGATLESSADNFIGAGLNTLILGGTFAENLRDNAMFFGLGFAEFAGPAFRRMRMLPPEELHGVAQLVNSANIERARLNENLRGTGIDPKKLFDAGDASGFLSSLQQEQIDKVKESIDNLRKIKEEFSKKLEQYHREGQLLPEAKTDVKAVETKADQVPGKQDLVSSTDTAAGHQERQLGRTLTVVQECERVLATLNMPEVRLRERFLKEKGIAKLSGEVQETAIQKRIDEYRRAVDVVASPQIQDRMMRLFEHQGEAMSIDAETQMKLRDFINEKAVEQQMDNPEQYVSHGFDHSLNVMAVVEKAAAENPQVLAAMEKNYGLSKAEGALMLKLIAVFHDFGYPELGKMGDGKLGKALHAVTGAEIADTPKFIIILEKALGKKSEGPEFQKLVRDFRDGILFHSADKVEVYRDAKVQVSHGEFIIDAQNIVDVYSGLKQQFPGQKLTIHCSPEIEAEMRERLGPDIAKTIDFHRPEANETVTVEGHERYRGRTMDLKTAKDRLLGVRFKEATIEGDPLNFMIRLADNCDITAERFSLVQRTEAFQQIYRRFGPLEGQHPPTGQILSVLENGNMPLRTLVESAPFQDCMSKTGNPELAELVEQVKRGMAVDTKVFTEKYKEAIVDKVLGEQMANPEQKMRLEATAKQLRISTEQLRDKIREIGLKQDSVSIRHFGGGEVAKSVRLRPCANGEAGMELLVTVDRTAYESFNKTIVEEQSTDLNGKKQMVSVRLGDYQIWRTYEAFRSLRQAEDKPIRVVVQDTNGQSLLGEGKDFALFFEHHPLSTQSLPQPPRVR